LLVLPLSDPASNRSDASRLETLPTIYCCSEQLCIDAGYRPYTRLASIYSHSPGACYTQAILNLSHVPYTANPRRSTMFIPWSPTAVWMYCHYSAVFHPRDLNVCTRLLLFLSSTRLRYFQLFIPLPSSYRIFHHSYLLLIRKPSSFRQVEIWPLSKCHLQTPTLSLAPLPMA
jgi:hypothetical protein